MIPDKDLEIKFQNAYDFEKIATAYHEAGHIIIGLINAIHVKSATIYDKKIGGVTTFNKFDLSQITDHNLKMSLASSYLHTFAAGPEAEVIFYKDLTGASKISKALRSGAQHDNLQINKLVALYSLKSDTQTRRNIKNIVNKNVALKLRQCWKEIKAVSHLLYSKEYLSFEHIKKAILRCTDNVDFWNGKFDSIESIYEGKL